MIHRRLAIIAIASTLLLGGCSLPFSGGGLPGPLGDNTSKSPKDLLQASVDALGKTKTFHVRLDAVLLVMDLDVQKGTGLAGTISVFGSQSDYLAVAGKVYLRSDSNKAALQRLGKPADTWVTQSSKNSTLDEFGGLSDYDFSKFFSCLTSVHGTLTKGQQTVVADVEVQEVKDAGDKPGSTPVSYYVAKKGTAYPIQMVAKGATQPGGNVPDACKSLKKSNPTPTPSGSSTSSSTFGGAGGATITFSQFDKKLDIKAPTRAVEQYLLGSSGSPFTLGSPQP